MNTTTTRSVLSAIGLTFFVAACASVPGAYPPPTNPFLADAPSIESVKSLPPTKVGKKVVDRQFESGRASIDDAKVAGTVTDARRRDAEEFAESIACHMSEYTERVRHATHARKFTGDP